MNVPELNKEQIKLITDLAHDQVAGGKPIYWVRSGSSEDKPEKALELDVKYMNAWLLVQADLAVVVTSDKKISEEMKEVEKNHPGAHTIVIAPSKIGVSMFRRRYECKSNKRKKELVN